MHKKNIFKNFIKKKHFVNLKFYSMDVIQDK